MFKPKISIIIRTKDRPQFLQEALLSFSKNNDLDDVESIIVNDGGSDVRHLVEKSFKQQRLFKYIDLQPNRGRCYAGNIGVENSSAPYIIFLDDDDLLYLSGVRSLLEKYESISCDKPVILYGKVEARLYEKIDSKGKLFKTFGRDFDPDALLWENFIPFNSIIIPKIFFNNAGGLDTKLSCFEDWDLFLRLSELADFKYYPILTAQYRIFDDSFILSSKSHRDWQEKGRLKILTKHYNKYSPEKLKTIYYLLQKERETWNMMDLDRSCHIQKLTSEIDVKGKYIDELEKEKINWKEMDKAREKYVQDLLTHIKNLENHIKYLTKA